MKSGFAIREEVKTFAKGGAVTGTAIVERPLSRKQLKVLAPALYKDARAKWPRRKREVPSTHWGRVLGEKYRREVLQPAAERRARQNLARKLEMLQPGSLFESVRNGLRRMFNRKAA